MSPLLRKQLVPMVIVLALAFIVAEPVLAIPGRGSRTGVTVASKRTKNVVITITAADSRLTAGENSLCVKFQGRRTLKPVDVMNVVVDFRLLVGRIEEQPIRSALAEVRKGEYCGRVNLGKLYYDPSSYYVFVHFTDGGGKKRTHRLFVSAISERRKEKFGWE